MEENPGVLMADPGSPVKCPRDCCICGLIGFWCFLMMVMLSTQRPVCCIKSMNRVSCYLCLAALLHRVF